MLEALATTLGAAMQQDDDDPDDANAAAEGIAGMPGLEGTPFAAMAGLAGMGNMMSMLAPALLGVQAGSMIGYLAQHALGRYDLPLPTSDVPSLCFVIENIDTFESEWSSPRDDLRFYVALHETVHAATRSVPWVRERLVELAMQYVFELRDRPVGVRSRVRDDRSGGPGVTPTAHRESRARPRRHAVAAPGRATAKSCNGSPR